MTTYLQFALSPTPSPPPKKKRKRKTPPTHPSPAPVPRSRAEKCPRPRGSRQSSKFDNPTVLGPCSLKVFLHIVNFHFNSFTPCKSDQFKTSSLRRTITPHSMKNLAFDRLLRWETIVLTNSLYLVYSFVFKRLGECTFWTFWKWEGSTWTGPSTARWLSWFLRWRQI